MKVKYIKDELGAKQATHPRSSLCEVRPRDHVSERSTTASALYCKVWLPQGTITNRSWAIAYSCCDCMSVSKSPLLLGTKFLQAILAPHATDSSAT
jgi:hypothetical protein